MIKQNLLTSKTLIIVLSHIIAITAGAFLVIALRSKDTHGSINADNPTDASSQAPDPNANGLAATAPSDSDDAVEGDIESFMDLLEDGLVTSESVVRGRVQEFNEHWKTKCASATPANPCIGQSELTLLDEGDVLTIRRRKLVHAVNAATGTATEVTDFVFEKMPGLKKISEIDGDSYRMQGGRFILGVPTRESCLGRRPNGDPATVTDTQTHKSIFEDRLAPEAENLVEINIAPSAPAHQALLSVTTELPLFEDKSCTTGQKVDRYVRGYVLNCDAQTAKCALTKTSETKTPACQSPGRCESL